MIVVFSFSTPKDQLGSFFYKGKEENTNSQKFLNEASNKQNQSSKNDKWLGYQLL